MRKDYKVGKIIKGRLFSTYSVEGLNLNKLLIILNREGIPVVDVRKKTNKRLILTIRAGYSQKFFAITNELCYNIKRVKYGGKVLPIYFLYKNIGWLCGIILLISLSFFFGGRVFEINYSGDGSVYSTYVSQYLEGRGIGKFTAFSEIDLKKLGNEIFASSDKFSFVNCTRRGNVLNVKLIAKNNAITTIDKSQMQLKSDVDGVVEKVRILRGTALVKEGDFIAKDCTLAEGYGKVGEVVVQTGIIGYVSVVYERQISTVFEGDNLEEYAEIFAQEMCGEILSISTEKIALPVGYQYLSTVRIRKIFTAG